MSLNYIASCIGNILSFHEYVYKKIVFFLHLDGMEQILSVINKIRKYAIGESLFTTFWLGIKAKI